MQTPRMTARAELIEAREGRSGEDSSDDVLLSQSIRHPMDRPLGIRPDRRRLSEAQELLVQTAIRSRLPAELGLAGKLWDRASTHALVHAITSVDLPQRTFSTYLERWGLIAPRPVHRIHATDPALIKQWMMRDHPVIAAQARHCGAQLLWFDVHRLDPLILPVPEGERASAPEVGDHMVFLSNGRGHQEWCVMLEKLTTHDLIEFLECATDNGRRRLHLIIRDRTPFVHVVFAHWLAEQQGGSEVFFIPDGT